MPYLIDGMNAIHAIDELADVLDESGPEKALNLLTSKLAQVWHDGISRIEIVMDGGGGDFGRRRHLSGILVHFPANGEDADGLIEYLVEKRPSYYVLVTNDRKLSKGLQGKTTGIMNVREFFVMVMNKSENRIENEQIKSESSRDEVDFWMKYFEQENGDMR